MISTADKESIERQVESLSIKDLLPATGLKVIDMTVEKSLENLLGISKIKKIYSDFPPANSAKQFLDTIITQFNIDLTVAGMRLDYIPKTGPSIIVANHPFGAIEGVILAQQMLSIRHDVKLLANYQLAKVNELRALFFNVDPFGSDGATKRNIRPMKEAKTWVENGGCLVVFPAGEVSHLQLDKKHVLDPKWNTAAARIMQKTNATVTPVFFHGKNSTTFQLAGLIHPRLRTALLIRELINKNGRSIKLSIGKTIHHHEVKHLQDPNSLTEYLRLNTYMLADLDKDSKNQQQKQIKSIKIKKENQQDSDIIEAVSSQKLIEEINTLPKSQQLVQTGDMKIYYAKGQEIPNVLQEIGRLREVTFRDVGEGTGKNIDLDKFDDYYNHLFIWNEVEQQIIGAYRICLTDKVIAEHGEKGLYTLQFLQYQPSFLPYIDHAVELGRSFVRPEYQKSFMPLMLLWKGISEFVYRHPSYHVLFGLVSISNDYLKTSQELLVNYLQHKEFNLEISSTIKAKQAFKFNKHSFWQTIKSVNDSDLHAVSELIKKIEPDNKGVPVLVKQYLKLGGKIAAFNVDPSFNDALDALIFVDLKQTSLKALQKHMGKEKAIDYLNNLQGVQAKAS